MSMNPEITTETKLLNLIACAKEALAALQDENEGVYKSRLRAVYAYAVNLKNEADDM